MRWRGAPILGRVPFLRSGGISHGSLSANSSALDCAAIGSTPARSCARRSVPNVVAAVPHRRESSETRVKIKGNKSGAGKEPPLTERAQVMLPAAASVSTPPRTHLHKHGTRVADGGGPSCRFRRCAPRTGNLWTLRYPSWPGRSPKNTFNLTSNSQQTEPPSMKPRTRRRVAAAPYSSARHRGGAAAEQTSPALARCGRFCNRFRCRCLSDWRSQTAGEARFSTPLLCSARKPGVERREVGALFASARRQNVLGAQAKSTWRRGSLGPTRSRRPSEGVSRAREGKKKEKTKAPRAENPTGRKENIRFSLAKRARRCCPRTVREAADCSDRGESTGVLAGTRRHAVA